MSDGSAVGAGGGKVLAGRAQLIGKPYRRVLLGDRKGGQCALGFCKGLRNFPDPLRILRNAFFSAPA